MRYMLFFTLSCLISGTTFTQVILSETNMTVTQGTTLFVDGNLNINAGEINLNEGAIISMGNNRTLSVNNGGSLNLNGSNTYPALISSPGYFNFDVNSGGTIGAQYAIFERMSANGLNIKVGATIDPALPFVNSVFRNGQAGGSLLTINNNQVVTISNAEFPANTWGGSYNVTKSVNSGEVTFADAIGGYAGTPFENDPFNRVFWGDELMTHSIQLPAGWSGLSSYLMPANNDIADIFAPIGANFIIAQTMSAAYYPAGSMNTIGTWMSQSAYTIKMQNAAVLSIIGMPETDKTYDLTTGWNLIPVITNNPINVATLPTTVGFQIVKDVAGTGVYWPAYSINTLGNLLPGKAYYVRVTSGGVITFPANTDAGWNGEYPKTPLLQTPWNQPVTSPVSHLVAFATGATAELLPGDIVGLFTPDNICCGVAQVETPIESLAITAFADDVQQPGTSGYVSGQTISLKVYRPATNEVITLAAVYETSGNGNVFADHGLSVITHIQQTATGIGTSSSASVEIYPNPTDGSVTITGIGQYNLLQLYSAHGELLLQRANDAADELSWDVSALPPGVYQLKLSGDLPAVVKKLIRK